MTKVQADRASLVPELPDPPGWVDLDEPFISGRQLRLETDGWNP